MIEKTFNKYKEKRISEKEYLEAMYKYAGAKAFYGSIHDIITEERATYETNKVLAINDLLGKVSLEVVDIIKEQVKVDWHENQDVKNNIEQAIEVILFDIMGEYELNIDLDTIDKINKNMQEIARMRF